MKANLFCVKYSSSSRHASYRQPTAFNDIFSLMNISCCGLHTKTWQSYLEDVGADGDDSLDGMVPQHDLRTIVNSLSVPNEWARLDALDFDGVVFATTSVKKEPFALLHERVLMFATDCTDIVIARLYFRGKERKDVPIRSVKEAAETFRYSDSAILCMGQAEFDNNYSKDITCHLKHSVDIVYGIVLSRSCSGIVSKEGKKHSACSASQCY
ncbi:hypothetical protein HPB51_025739 [Rhipicephalus microplus]|uniref:Uncharacterized protein n=1 Tax=Rhipicephalus microplus TaxID=6941 RepID=A0A9J6FA84_RHIMP|nr:hypothetical protein HPB51_025739 [Rhipicephalus microplus]